MCWPASAAKPCWAKPYGMESVTTAAACSVTAWLRQAVVVLGLALPSHTCSRAPTVARACLSPLSTTGKMGTCCAIGT